MANGLNQLTSYAGQSLSHDANGNVTSDGSNSYGYDVENKMTSATVAGQNATLSYDPLGRFYRVAKDGGIDRRFSYDGLDMVEQRTAGHRRGLRRKSRAINWAVAAVIALKLRRQPTG